MNKAKILPSSLIILVFLIAVYGKRSFAKWFTVSFDSAWLQIFYAYAWWLLPIVLCTGLLFGFPKLLEVLGLKKGFLRGLLLSLALVSPMLISSALMGEVDAELKLSRLLHKTLFAGFMEELLFRAFLFGLLFRKLGWGFIPASALGAVIFGLNHLYQGSSIPVLIGLFFVTFIASAWFAWLYIEWENNLWLPIFLHVFMNLSWTLFNVSDNALGGLSSNIFRIITIALSVILTIRMAKRREVFRINRTNLF